MKEKGKVALIIIALIGFITIGALLLAQIGVIGQIGATINYDANGCPKDGKKWTYVSKTNTCTTTVSPTTKCESGYSWSSKMQKCYKKATYVSKANVYTCGADGSSLLKTSPEGNNVCTKNKTVKECKKGVLTDDKCVISQKSTIPEYKVTYNGNGGSATNSSGKKYSAWSETVVYNSKYVTRNNMFYKNSKTFIGWNTKADGTGKDWTQYINTPSTYSLKSNVTLYAQWKSGPLVVTSNSLRKCFVNNYGHADLSIIDLLKINTLNCDNDISDLTDIKYLYNLKAINFGNFTGTKLDLSTNPKLTRLNVRIKGNQSLALNVSKNTKLTELYLIGNSKAYISSTKINLAKNTKLGDMILYNLANVTDIVLPNSTSLTELKIKNLPKLKSLDLKKNTNLQRLEIEKAGNLNDVNLTKNTKLTFLSLSELKIGKLDLTKNTKLTSLGLTSLGNVASLNLTKNTNLMHLNLHSLTKLKTLKLPTGVTLKTKNITSCPNLKL